MSNPLYDALIKPHNGRSTTFLHLPDDTLLSHTNFIDLAGRYAAALNDLDVMAGDRVAVHIQKSADALALYAACLQLGAVFLPLNTAYTPTELEYFISDSDASVVICDPGEINEVAAIAKSTGATLRTMGAAGEGSLKDAALCLPPRTNVATREQDDIAALLYTSGTTGRSKGAMLTHRNLLSNAQVLVDIWRFSDTDVLLHALPIFHSHGLFVASNVTLLAGGSMIWLAKFDTDKVLSQLPNATTMMGVPTFYTRLLGDARFDKDLTQHMRLFISGSAPLLSETHERFEARTGHLILERYGMTETSMNTSNPYDGARRAGTVGFPLPDVEAKICDPKTGASLPVGKVGMLEVRGPNVFKGYWKMPKKTAEELREDGFFITGDLAQKDENGYISIVGRGKDLIISGGFNIYPKEIEMFLDNLPDVLESAVIGAPHPDFGESVVAVIVPVTRATLNIAAIEAEVKDKLAGFKRPRHFEVLETLPRNTMGKVQKNELRAQFENVFN
ncbi:long-chain-fatty-acid--CoA ligase FadD (plasmid) [Octadecabacter antarcticus 307]|uniref:Long-chain-fatty-acid--CoA ligase FadD n=1 Tax=Octadecabacter antarcticus 307 TaxID=391626 RepID=M9RES2_9RHOB|nr:malonyl-CoA synthase [Octadecabacter antarcticus]AGI70248.1 long-chain-fatty-acid--CoA ligase FadD [Octadecabacter antarcticus 307]